MCRKLNKLLNNELKFVIVKYLLMYVRYMNRHCIPGLIASAILTGNFSAGVSGNN